jgi:hypothetical protein
VNVVATAYFAQAASQIVGQWSTLGFAVDQTLGFGVALFEK